MKLTASSGLFAHALLIASFAAHGQTPAFTPSAAASISGRVLDSLSNPYEARVQAFQFVVRDGHTDLLPKCLADVGADGSYRCNGLEPGTFIVVLRPDPVSTLQPPLVRPKLDWKYPRTIFYPYTTDFEEADRVLVAAGKTTWCDFHLADTPLPSANVSAPLTGLEKATDLRLYASSGSFQIDSNIPLRRNIKANIVIARNVPKGHYTLKAFWVDLSGTHLFTKDVVVGNQSVTIPALDADI